MTSNPKLTNAGLALRVSLISRIAAQYTHELAYGMWNPDFCSAEAGFARDRFLEDMDRNLNMLRRDGESHASKEKP